MKNNFETMNLTIEEIKNQVVEEFNLFDDWMDRYDYLIDQGKKLTPLGSEFKNDDYIIKGCQSQVWLNAYLNGNGKIIFEADSDAIITKGMIALLIRVFSNQDPEEVEKADILFLDRIGLKEQLSPTRSNGLMSMIRQMKYYAVALKASTGKN